MSHLQLFPGTQQNSHWLQLLQRSSFIIIHPSQNTLLQLSQKWHFRKCLQLDVSTCKLIINFSLVRDMQIKLFSSGTSAMGNRIHATNSQFAAAANNFLSALILTKNYI